MMLADSHGLRRIIVRYERLTNRPQDVLNDICRQLDLAKWSFDVESPVKRQNMQGKPFSVSGAPNFDQASLDKLSADVKKIIQQEAGEMLTYWGY